MFCRWSVEKRMSHSSSAFVTSGCSNFLLESVACVVLSSPASYSAVIGPSL